VVSPDGFGDRAAERGLEGEERADIAAAAEAAAPKIAMNWASVAQPPVTCAALPLMRGRNKIGPQRSGALGPLFARSEPLFGFLKRE
jgi:hypothetical protein